MARLHPYAVDQLQTGAAYLRDTRQRLEDVGQEVFETSPAGWHLTKAWEALKARRGAPRRPLPGTRRLVVRMTAYTAAGGI